MAYSKIKAIISATTALLLSVSVLGYSQEAFKVDEAGAFSITAEAADRVNVDIPYLSSATSVNDYNYYINLVDYNTKSITVYQKAILDNDDAYTFAAVKALRKAKNIESINYYTSGGNLVSFSVSSLSDVNFRNACIDQLIASLNYYDNTKIGDLMMKRVNTLAQQICRNRTGKYDKVKAIYDYLMDNTEYSCDDLCPSIKRLGTEWAAFCNRDNRNNPDKKNKTRVTCGGYSRAFALLANAAGVRTYMSAAWGANNEWGHEFNVVELNGGYYFVDVSNDNCANTRYKNFLLDYDWFYYTDPNHRGSMYHNCTDIEVNHNFKDWSRNRHLILPLPRSLNDYYNTNGTYMEANTPYKVYYNSNNLYGDIDGDGYCNAADLLCLKDHISKEADYSDRKFLDMNQDGRVDTSDLMIMQNHIDLRAKYRR